VACAQVAAGGDGGGGAALGLAVALVDVAAQQDPKEGVHGRADRGRARDDKLDAVQAQPHFYLVEYIEMINNKRQNGYCCKGSSTKMHHSVVQKASE